MKLHDTSVFSAHSPQAEAIARLFTFDLLIAAAIFATVTSLVLFVSFRFRRRPGAREPRQVAGNTILETLWTVIPALILVVLFFRTARTMEIVNPPPRGRRPNVEVIAHQYWWEYRYPASGVITANELHLPARADWLLQILSADVVHDFWVPDLGAKVEAIPGHPNYLWMQAWQPGIYLGTCAQFCGNQHALMGIRVIVEPPAQFAAWQQEQLRVPPPPTGPEQQQGARLFEKLTCPTCHAIAGTPAQARVGPDLTHLADRQTLAAGVLTNTLDTLTRWLQHPQQFKPGCYMPDLELTRNQAQTIAFYLEGLK